MADFTPNPPTVQKNHPPLYGQWSAYKYETGDIYPCIIHRVLDHDPTEKYYNVAVSIIYPPKESTPARSSATERSIGRIWDLLRAIHAGHPGRVETKCYGRSLHMSAPAPSPVMDPDPNAEKYQQYIGLGGVIFGFLAAAWSKMRCPSKDEVNRWVDERIEHRELLKLLERKD